MIQWIWELVAPFSKGNLAMGLRQTVLPKENPEENVSVLGRTVRGAAGLAILAMLTALAVVVILIWTGAQDEVLEVARNVLGVTFVVAAILALTVVQFWPYAVTKDGVNQMPDSTKNNGIL